MCLPHPAIYFTNTGGVEEKRASYRAHVQWKDAGMNRNIGGPCQSDQETAQRHFDCMRSATNGVERAEGVVAMGGATARFLQESLIEEKYLL